MRRYLARLYFLVAAGFTLAACAAGPVILSDYASPRGVNGGTRYGGSHAGVDFGEILGAPVLAAAGGMVVSSGEWRGCGVGIVISHADFYRYTVYCHLHTSRVKSGQWVKRGDDIGQIGMTGAAWGVPHVHFEVTTFPQGHGDGNLHGTEDPMKYLAGCFDPQKTYPTDRLVLTYPVRCKN